MLYFDSTTYIRIAQKFTIYIKLIRQIQYVCYYITNVPSNVIPNDKRHVGKDNNIRHHPVCPTLVDAFKIQTCCS